MPTQTSRRLIFEHAVRGGARADPPLRRRTARRRGKTGAGRCSRPPRRCRRWPAPSRWRGRGPRRTAVQRRRRTHGPVPSRRTRRGRPATRASTTRRHRRSRPPRRRTAIALPATRRARTRPQPPVPAAARSRKNTSPASGGAAPGPRSTAFELLGHQSARAPRFSRRARAVPVPRSVRSRPASRRRTRIVPPVPGMAQPARDWPAPGSNRHSAFGGRDHRRPVRPVTNTPSLAPNPGSKPGGPGDACSQPSDPACQAGRPPPAHHSPPGSSSAKPGTSPGVEIRQGRWTPHRRRAAHHPFAGGQPEHPARLHRDVEHQAHATGGVTVIACRAFEPHQAASASRPRTCPTRRRARRIAGSPPAGLAPPTAGRRSGPGPGVRRPPRRWRSGLRPRPRTGAADRLTPSSLGNGRLDPRRPVFELADGHADLATPRSPVSQRPAIRRRRQVGEALQPPRPGPPAAWPT